MITARRRVLRVRSDQAHRAGSFGLPADGRGHSPRRRPGPDGPGPALPRLAEGPAGRYRVRLRLADHRQRPHRRGSPPWPAARAPRTRAPRGTRAARGLPRRPRWRRGSRRARRPAARDACRHRAATGLTSSTNPDDFIGKLVVMLLSRDATSPPAEGTPQPVNGRPGMFNVQGDIQSLTFQIVGGQWVVVQAPVSLGWNSAELARFASGVQVLVTAQQGRG